MLRSRSKTKSTEVREEPEQEVYSQLKAKEKQLKQLEHLQVYLTILQAQVIIPNFNSDRAVAAQKMIHQISDAQMTNLDSESYMLEELLSVLRK